MKERIKIDNFATITAQPTGRVYETVTDEQGQELGIRVRGLLTAFNIRNANGMNFAAESYDKFVDDYFVRNSLNVPAYLDHIEDTEHRIGKVESMTKTDDGVEVVVYIPRGMYYYGLAKTQLDNGILQAFSNSGYATEAEYDKETDTLNIKEFALSHVALVPLPGDVKAKFELANTKFTGFTSVEEPKKEEPAEEVWRLLV